MATTPSNIYHDTLTVFLHDTTVVHDTVRVATHPPFRFGWPERWDQWLLWGLGAALTVFVAMRGLHWSRDKDRRDVVTRISEDHHALLAQLRQFFEFLVVAKNPCLPEEALTDFSFYVDGFEIHRPHLALLKSPELRRKLIGWYAGLNRLKDDARQLFNLDAALHSAPNGSQYMIPFKQALLAFRELLPVAISASEEVERLIAEERLGWRLRWWKPSVGVFPPPWPKIAKRGYWVQP